jgi:acetyltransferase-like isoleucine patch superfamily enzyme
MRRLLMMLQGFFLRLHWRARAGARLSLLAVFTPGCRFGRNARVERMCILHDTELGDYSYIGDGSRAIRSEIGRFCSIAGSVQIGLGNHPSGMVSTSPAFYTNRNAVRTHWVEKPPEFEEYKKTVIGSDVWIGMRAMIRDGVTIGDGSIIGAGAIVTHDVEPYSVMAGVPARCIRKRFDDETIEKLLALRWWDWPEEEIRRSAGQFTSIGEFLQNHPENAIDANRSR